jgi:nucleotide-binding universal stress UspA family protein
VEGRFTKYFRRMSKQMLDERIRRYEDADINKISCKIRTGKIVDAIVHQSEETDCDLIVMTSSKIILYVRLLRSVVRRVLDSIRKPILIIHE